MELNFNSPIVKNNIKVISAYFEAKAEGKKAELIIDGQVILTCHGFDGNGSLDLNSLDENDKSYGFGQKGYDYESTEIAFYELEEALKTFIVKEEITTDGVKVTKAITIKHPIGQAPKGAEEWDTTNYAELTQSGIGKMHTWLMMTNETYRKGNKKELMKEWLFNPSINTDGSIRFVRNYYEQETLTCHLVKDKDIKNTWAITQITKHGLDYGTAYPVANDGDNSHTGKSDYFYTGYGA